MKHEGQYLYNVSRHFKLDDMKKKINKIYVLSFKVRFIIILLTNATEMQNSWQTVFINLVWDIGSQIQLQRQHLRHLCRHF